MRFEVLGPLRVVAGGAEPPILVPAARQRILLAALLRRASQPVSVEELAELVWDGSPPRGAVATTQAYVMRLRRVLGEQAGGRILTRDPGYVIELDEDELDTACFEVLCRDAGAALRGGDWAGVSARAGQALALWRGTPLADVASQTLRDLWLPHLDQLRVQALEWSAEADLHLGRHAQLVPQLRELISQHPLRERFHAQLMLALARGGRQAESLEVYQQARRRLVDELGVEPGPELRDLHRRVLAGDPDLLAGHAPASSTPASSTSAGGGVPHRLPADTRVFTGRQAELTGLLKLAGTADGARGPGAVVISAIDGMAGIGKTALAVHAAHLLAERFSDGQLFIDLHGYTQGYPPRTADQALETFLRTLGIPPQKIPDDVEERAALYRERLAGTRTLIVLDNAADEAQVRPLIPGHAGCLVLITSRRKLKALDDSHAVALDVLPEPDAIALFRTVAGPGRAAHDDRVVASIADLCGRLPLAVRIAAALLRNRPAWSPEHLADRLRAAHARLDALFDGDRDLAAIFGLSSQALDDEQRRLYRYLGLIPGPEADAYAATALLNTHPAAAERLLQELVDHNLLLEPAPGRYRMHDLIRAHACALAAAEPSTDAALDRLLNYYQHTARRADAAVGRYAVPSPADPGPAHAPALPDTDAAQAWLRIERANLTACLQYAINRGRDEHIVAFSAGLGSLLRTDGPWPQATAPHTAAAAAAVRLGDRPAQARALTELGSLRRLTGDYPAADLHFQAALALWREAGNKSGQAHVLTERAIMARVSGDYPAADRNIQAALVLWREAGNKSGQARTLTELGSIRYVAGDYQDSERHLQAALALYQEVSDKTGQARALNELAEVQRLTGDYEGAMRNAEASRDICTELGDRLGQANTLSVLGKLLRLTGDYEGAAWHQQAALDVYTELGDRLGQANTRTLLAVVRSLNGDHARAARDLEDSIGTYRDLGNRGNEAWALNHYATVISATGDLSRAIALYDEGLRLAREVRQPDDEADALEGIGENHLRMGNLHEGASYLHQALEIYRRLGMPAAEQVTALLAEIGAPE